MSIVPIAALGAVGFFLFKRNKVSANGDPFNNRNVYLDPVDFQYHINLTEAEIRASEMPPPSNPLPVHDTCELWYWDKRRNRRQFHGVDHGNLENLFIGHTEKEANVNERYRHPALGDEN